jgi:hypothetical protein
MTSTCWWLMDLLSRMLDRDERDAVRGDLAELRTGAGRALVDILGLVVRRQAAFWKSWRQWVTLLGLIIPLGLMLGVQPVLLGRSYDLYLWIAGNYRAIDPGLLQDDGLKIGSGILFLVCHSLLLAGWSWSAGFVLGALSRRAIAVNGALFCLVLLGVEWWSAPKSRYYVAGAVFAKTLSSLILPVILLAILVVLPAVWGMYQGRRLVTLWLPHAVLWAAMIAGLSVLAPTALWWWNWPAGYMLIAAAWRHWHRPIASA